VRILIVAAAVATLANPPSGLAAPFAESDAARIQTQLEKARYARVALGGRTITVEHPRADPSGLAYRHAIGFPPPRPAVFVTGDWDSLSPPPNPIPWSEIQRVEAGRMSRRTTALFGAGVGLVLGVGTGYALARWAEGAGGDTNVGGWMTGVGAVYAVVGAGIGALFSTPTWREVRPAAERGGGQPD